MKNIYLAVAPLSETLYENRAYTLPWHLPAFLAGTIAYFWVPRFAPPPWLSLGAIACLLAFLSTGEGAWSANSVVAITVLLIALCHQSTRSSTMLGCRPLAFIGRISFSVYLTHYILGPILAYPLLSLAVTIALSTATYYLIEQPARELGRHLIRTRHVGLYAERARD